MTHSVSIPFQGSELILETGKIARQANGAVFLRLGENVLLSTACCSDEPSKLSFFPLTVEYREKTAAAGRFPGGYMKREGRPSEKEILTCRIIDRPIRPLIDKRFHHEVQLINNVLSSDTVTDQDVLAITATSAALLISDIPFEDPIAGVRVGMIDGQYVINPNVEQLADSVMDLVIAGTADTVTMIEGSAKEQSENVVLKAVEFGHETIKELVKLQRDLQALAGKTKIVPVEAVDTTDIKEKIKSLVKDDLKAALLTTGKKAKSDATKALRAKAIEALLPEEGAEDETITEALIKDAFDAVKKEEIRRLIIEEDLRQDSRNTKQIRPITSEIGILPRTHGSALFTRGETQSLASITLGSVPDEQRYDTYNGEASKKFMVHYNFPPFCVGEVKPLRGVGRREIGHGVLAERSLLQVLPEDNSYTIKLVSDITESNGSSSMATVCAGTLSLLNAGIKITSPVAGIAMGLIKEGDKVRVLSDILGSADACGDMDFKVTGTEKGITGFQLDLKIKGISYEIMEQALLQAKDGRMHILGEMAKTISTPNESLSEYAPKIDSIMIDVDKIGMVIGPGGKNIKKIIADTGANINIDDDGRVTFASSSAEAIAAARKIVSDMTAEAEVGVIYKGTVKSILPFGCFVEILPGKEGLVHISKLAHHRVGKVEDVVKLGDVIDVKLVEFDDRGRMNLSRRDAVPADADEKPATEE